MGINVTKNTKELDCGFAGTEFEVLECCVNWFIFTVFKK